MFGRENLCKLRLMAMRRRVWFRALSRVDRALVELTIRVAGKVRSSALTKALAVVVGKLEEAFENQLSNAVRTVGVPLARKLGLIAVGWGNRQAEGWVRDVGFARFLAAMHMNSSADCGMV
jgi:hypothetical protein